MIRRFLLSLTATVLAYAQGSYVDSKVCATCHADIARTYAKTGMARSFYQPAPGQDFRGANPYHQQLSDTWYAMERRDGKIYQRRWRIGPDGKEVQVAEFSVD